MARWLITGGAGFIGCNAADTLLRAGHAVTIHDDDNPARAFAAVDDQRQAGGVARLVEWVSRSLHLFEQF